MDKYESREELAAIIDNEGFYYWLFDYGVKPEMMPDEELKSLMEDIKVHSYPLRYIMQEFRSKLPESY